MRSKIDGSRYQRDTDSCQDTDIKNLDGVSWYDAPRPTTLPSVLASDNRLDRVQSGPEVRLWCNPSGRVALNLG